MISLLDVIHFYCRVLRELEVIRQEATLLKEQMRLVKDDIKAVLSNKCCL